MDGPRESESGDRQLLLGKKLLERGLITPDQLREALVERARGVTGGDPASLQIGSILISKGYLTKQQLFHLMSEQEQSVALSDSRVEPPPATPTGETFVSDTPPAGQQLLLGKMLLERGIVTTEQLMEALAERARGAGEGESPSAQLGSILIRKGYLSPDQLSEIRAEQGDERLNSAKIAGMMMTAAASETQAQSTRLGKYALLREIGRGGMGVVYEGFDTQLKRKVAIKLMIASPNADPKEIALDEERFVREAQLSAKLKHPNIVTVYEAGVIEGRRFLAMELIDGQPLSSWRKTGSVTIRLQVSVLRDVAVAVHAAHEQGILHRDLKPRNILVEGKNRAFVTDFGLAKTLGTNVSLSLTGSGAVVGTPSYMSPEQAQGSTKLDWRTDIWSLGAMLYEILTGRPPFGGESPIEILMKVVKDPVVPPSKIVEAGAGLGLDKGIENVCLKALAKNYKHRYVTAKAFADDLTRWLKGEVIRVTPPRQKKSSVRAYVAGAAAGLLLVAAAAYFQPFRPSVKAELDRARALMKEKRYAEAQRAYTDAFLKDPSNREARAGEAEAIRLLALSNEEDLRRKLAALEEEYRKAREEIALRTRAEAGTVSQAELEKLAAKRRESEARAKKAEEEAEKIRRALPGHPSPTPPSPVEEAAWTGASRLLPLVDPARDTVGGMWTWRDGRLSSDRSRHARIEIPFRPPEEYDLRLVFMRQAGADAVGVVLSRQDRTFAWLMGAMNNTAFGFESIAGARAWSNASTVPALSCLKNDRLYTCVLQVRKDGIRAYLEGQPLTRVETDYSNLGLDEAWALRSPGVLGLVTHESPTLFHRLELLEVAGKGEPVERPELPPHKAQAIDPASLKPGLVAEYFYGTAFDSLGLRKIDPAVEFRWKEGPGWTGGPVDAFSVRWSGYLQVPKTARCTFVPAPDDAVRLVIDDVQVLASSSHADTPASATCHLEEGLHRILLEFSEKAGPATAVLSWSDSTAAAALPISPKSFFHDPAGFLPYGPAPVPGLAAVLPGHADSVTGVVFTEDGKTLVTAGQDRRIILWDPATKKPRGTIGGHSLGILAVAVSRDGRFLATAGYDRKIKIWDLPARKELHTLEGHTQFIESLAFSHDGRWLASGSYDSTVRIWDVTRGRGVHTLRGHAGGVACVAFNPESTLVASGSTDHTIRLWDAHSGRESRVLTGHPDFVEAVAFSPDGRMLASGGWDNKVRLWEVDTGRELRVLSGHTAEVMSVAFSPDGRVLASAGNDAIIRLWDVEKGTQKRTLPGHAGQIISLAFARETWMLASGSFDSTVRLWDLKGE